MAEPGLRERKKARTRQQIADAAARLFAEHGYEQVTVSDIAREAEVAPQTVYNYFATKEQLVTDREREIADRLVGLIADRAPGVSPAVAVRDYALQTVDGISGIAPELWRGELGYLSAVSPTVYRLVLEMSDRQANAILEILLRTTDLPPAGARLRAVAIAGVFQYIVSAAGQRTQAGLTQTQIATELRPIVDEMIVDLDAWFTASATSCLT